MYLQSEHKIWIATGDTPIYIEPGMANRHGLIAGATGTGKTVSLKVLAEGFAHVRVDLYNVDGKIYFGEMTFTNGGGFDRILPMEYDKMLGDLWNLPRLNK